MVLKQNVHLVELDLLVGGRRLPMQEPLPPADYYYLVSRPERRPDCNVYPWKVKQPLPKLPVPLLSPDEDIVVDLAAVFSTAYERGRFGRRINYQSRLPAGLSGEDQRWAADIV